MKWISKTFVFVACSAVATAQTGPILRLSTTAVVPPPIAAGVNATTQTVQIYNAGSGTLSPSVTSSVSWVSATVGAQATCPAGTFTGSCQPLTLTFNTSSLAVGTYTGLISVTAPAAVDAPQTIAVTVSVIGFVSKNAIQLYAAPDGGTATATLDAHGVVNAQPSTSTGGNWLSVSLSSNGSFSFYYPYQVKVTTQSGQTPGNYTGSIAISGSNTASDNVTVPVDLTVTTSPIAQLSTSAVTLIGGVNTQLTSAVSIANAGEGSLSVSSATATVSTGSGWLSAVLASGGGSVTITADTSSLSPGAYQGSVSIATNAINGAALMVPVSLLVTSQTGPQINIGGIVDNAVGKSPVAIGDIAAAYGSQFSSAGFSYASNIPLPTTLGDLQVLVNNVAAPLFFTSTGQIDLQIPYATPIGTAVVQVVTNGVAGNKVSVQVVAREPKVLAFGAVPIIIDYNTGKIPVSAPTVLPNEPAVPGDTLVIYCVGLGQTTPVAITGASPTSSPLQDAASPVTVTLGGGFSSTTTLTPSYAGLAPGFVGLYQVNVTIPTTYVPPSGKSVMLTVSQADATALPVTIDFQ